MNTIITFLAIMALAAFFAGLPGVRPGTAPLLALCSAMLFCSAFGMAGLLVPGGWGFLFICFALFAFAVFRGRSALLKKLASFPFFLFFGLGVLWFTYLAVRQPLFIKWDEFTLWGTAPKLMKLGGTLFTTADIGWWWPATQHPALMVLSWFMQFFGAPFAEWKVYFAYGLLFFACTCALLAAVPKQPQKNLHKTIAAYAPLAVAGLIVPFFFNVAYHTIYFNTTYLSAYGDLPAGMLAGASLAVYFTCRPIMPQPAASAKAAVFTGWQPALVLAALALVKENTMPVALVCAGVMAADTLFFGKGRHIGKRIAAFLGFFAATTIPYIAWSRYLTQLKTAAGTQDTNIGIFTAAGIAVRQLFGLEERTPQFAQTTQNLVDRFMGHVVVGGEVAEGTFNISMAGSGFATCLFVLFVFALAIAFAPTARGRGRIGLTCGLLAGGFVLYQFSLLVFYGVLFHAKESMEIVDYDRYLATYLMAWLLCGLAFLAGSLFAPAKETTAKTGTNGKAATGLHQTLALASVVLLATGMLLRFNSLVRPGYSVLDYPQNVYDEQRHRQASANALMQHMPQNARVFFVCQGGDGGEWFEYSYYLLPAILEYSITGGGSFWPQQNSAAIPAGETTPDGQTPEMLREYLEENGCNYIYVYNTDEVFTQNFGSLFANDLQDWPNTPSLYSLRDDGLYHFVASA